MRRLKYRPLDREYARPASTNCGDFQVGQIIPVEEGQEREAERLVECGDFVFVDIDGNEIQPGTEAHLEC